MSLKFRYASYKRVWVCVVVVVVCSDDVAFYVSSTLDIHLNFNDFSLSVSVSLRSTLSLSKPTTTISMPDTRPRLDRRTEKLLDLS